MAPQAKRPQILWACATPTLNDRHDVVGLPERNEPPSFPAQVRRPKTSTHQTLSGLQPFTCFPEQHHFAGHLQSVQVAARTTPTITLQDQLPLVDGIVPGTVLLHTSIPTPGLPGRLHRLPTPAAQRLAVLILWVREPDGPGGCRGLTRELCAGVLSRAVATGQSDTQGSNRHPSRGWLKVRFNGRHIHSDDHTAKLLQRNVLHFNGRQHLHIAIQGGTS